MKNQATPSGWKYPLVMLILAVLALLVMDFNSRTAELHRLAAERENAAGEITQAVQTRQALQATLAYATSDLAVEDFAYQDGQMVRNGDVPVIPVPAGTVTPTVQPTQPVVQVTSSPLDRWFSLFTDPRAP